MEGPQFLRRRFNAHAGPEIERAAERTKMRTGEKVSQDPEERIQNYLDRFKEITERKDPEEKSRGMRALKKIMDEAYVIRPEDIPESYFALQQQIARELGHGTIDITPEKRKEAIKVIQADQRTSLNAWIDYLGSDDALYPDWAKYWAFRSLVGMSLYDKEKKQYGKRSKSTTAKFPDLNREALAYVVDAIQKTNRGENIPNPVERGNNDFAQEGKLVSDEDFQHMLSTENFARYYAFAMEHVVSDNSELFKITEGEWRAFNKGSDPLELTKTLQGHGTGWCTAGESTAAEQLQMGDFHVYYSHNALGVSTIPRLAIRMEDDDIAEVRGVAHEQEIDPYIAPVLEEKLSEFGADGEAYKRKAEQMKHLTRIDKKTAEGEALTVEDLRFLYEVEERIEGFGYGRDPRIREIIEKRDRFEDSRLILGSQNDNEYMLKLLYSGQELTCSIIGIAINEEEEGDNKIDWNEYDSEYGKFLQQHLPKMSNLSTRVARQILELGYGYVIADARDAFASKDKFEIVDLLMEYDQKNGSEYFDDMMPGFFRNMPLEEGLAFIDEHIEKGNSELLSDLIRDLKNIPLRIAKKLIKAGKENVLASGLKNFEPGLDSEVATALIDAGYAMELSDNLKLFHGLNREIWEELNGRAFFNDLEKNPQSFEPEEPPRDPFNSRTLR